MHSKSKSIFIMVQLEALYMPWRSCVRRPFRGDFQKDNLLRLSERPGHLFKDDTQWTTNSKNKGVLAAQAWKGSSPHSLLGDFRHSTKPSLSSECALLPKAVSRLYTFVTELSYANQMPLLPYFIQDNSKSIRKKC